MQKFLLIPLMILGFVQAHAQQPACHGGHPNAITGILVPPTCDLPPWLARYAPTVPEALFSPYTDTVDTFSLVRAYQGSAVSFSPINHFMIVDNNSNTVVRCRAKKGRPYRCHIMHGHTLDEAIGIIFAAFAR